MPEWLVLCTYLKQISFTNLALITSLQQNGNVYYFVLVMSQFSLKDRHGCKIKKNAGWHTLEAVLKGY